MNSTSLFYELRVAEILGIHRDFLKELRQRCLKKKKDWRIEGREIVLTESGLLALLHALEDKNHAGGHLTSADFAEAIVEGPQLNGAPEKKEVGGLTQPVPIALLAASAVERATSTVELTVHHACLNYRLVEAVDPNDATKRVRVRVPNNENFRPRMRLKARPIDGQNDYYQLVGRCPRRPGRY